MNIPDDLIATRYRIRYRSDEFSFSRFRFVSVSISNRDTELTYSITGLTRNTEYTVEVRFEGRYRQCFSYLYGNYSAPVTFMTNLTGRLMKCTTHNYVADTRIKSSPDFRVSL